MTKILFDESHGEFLGSQLTADPKAWNEVRKILGEELKYEVLPPHSADRGSLADGILDEQQDVDVLVLAAPTQALTSDEIEAIAEFVGLGKSLLIANNYRSLKEREHRHKINELLEPLGLQAQQLVSYPPEKVSNLHPHYISSGVQRLAIKDPAYLKVLNETPQVVATLPETGKPFLVTVEANPGRVVAMGDFSLLGDSYIQEDDNRRLVLNLFRWLAYDNLLDFGGVHMNPEVSYGRAEVFSVTLVNSYRQKRLEGIHCSLESDSLALIEKPSLEVRPLLRGESSQLKWIVEPRQLGSQSLRLRVDFPQNVDHSALILDPVVQFKCVPDAEFALIITDHQGKELETVETDVPFYVEAVVCWKLNAKQVPLKLALDSPLAPITIEQIDAVRWRLTALDVGTWTIKLTVKETDQEKTRSIQIYPSPQFQITKVERDIVSALAAKVKHWVSQLSPEFDVDVIQQIPFRLFTPEEQVCKLYPPHIQEHLLEALQAVRSETLVFAPLVEDLLLNIAPTYSPQHGCCIPYDPKLAAHLIRQYSRREKSIAYNFLCVEGNNLYGQNWLEGNIAALLLHEKYGHGFFYTQTTLGRQLALLYRHGLLREVDAERLRSPYLRTLHQEYGKVIQMLHHSALLLNEGFATWVELTGLQRLSGIFEETVHRRQEFLFQDSQLRILIPRSHYFQRFDPGPGSKYQIMYERLQDIQSFFSDFDPAFGFRCAVQAMSKAADVDFGITEQDGQIQFRLRADKIEALLLDDRKDYEAGADRRMNSIWSVLQDYSDQLQDNQARLKLQDRYLHSKSMVNKIIEEKLGW